MIGRILSRILLYASNHVSHHSITLHTAVARQPSRTHLHDTTGRTTAYTQLLGKLSLASLRGRRLQVVLEKRPLNGCLLTGVITDVNFEEAGSGEASTNTLPGVYHREISDVYS